MKNIYFYFLIIILINAIEIKSQTAADAAKHQEMMEIITQKPKVDIKTIGVFVYDGFNNLDAMGPYQVLSEVSGAKVFLIAKNKGIIKNQSKVITNIVGVSKVVSNIYGVSIPITKINDVSKIPISRHN